MTMLECTSMNDFAQCTEQLIIAGQELYRQGMVPATSGNFSMRLAGGNVAITVSGAHKGKLTEQDIMQINLEGESLDGKKPSAETLLHVQIYKNVPDAKAVLHPHMMNAILLARINHDIVKLENYELLKALDGIQTHTVRVMIPIFANDQNISRLANKVQTVFDEPEKVYAYIIQGHGVYTWGKSMADAMRHIEALDYLFACELHSGG